jgi:hypothetical protein
MSGNKTRKQVPWTGWSLTKPTRSERKLMSHECKKQKINCFLGPNKSFPICDKGTCNVNDKGLWAAYVRAREWSSPRKTKKSRKHHQNTYRRIAQTAKLMLEQRGFKVKGK